MTTDKNLRECALPGCGITFLAPPNAQTKKFCSRSHLRKSYNRNEIILPKMCELDGCSEMFTPRPNVIQRFCSEQHRHNQYHQQGKPRQSVITGAPRVWKKYVSHFSQEISPNWQDAACAHYDAGMWDVPDHRNAEAVLICDSCPIKDVCLSFGIASNAVGVIHAGLVMEGGKPRSPILTVSVCAKPGCHKTFDQVGHKKYCTPAHSIKGDPTPRRTECAREGCSVSFPRGKHGKKFCSRAHGHEHLMESKGAVPFGAEAPCGACSKGFIRSKSNLKYCSDECKKRGQRVLQRKWDTDMRALKRFS